MNASTLDPDSRHIPRLLAADGRASYQAIADEVGLSRPAVMERVKRMEESGSSWATPRGSTAASRLPHHRLRRRPIPCQPNSSAGAGGRGAGDNPSVLECHHVAGEDCYILKVAAPSLEASSGVLRGSGSPGTPVSTRTTIVLSSVFEKPGSSRWRLD